MSDKSGKKGAIFKAEIINLPDAIIFSRINNSEIYLIYSSEYTKNIYQYPFSIFEKSGIR